VLPDAVALDDDELALGHAAARPLVFLAVRGRAVPVGRGAHQVEALPTVSGGRSRTQAAAKPKTVRSASGVRVG
jgi:hypothetical protein